jgi:diguanylate cyclase (GGDEF)-like protein
LEHRRRLQRQDHTDPVTGLPSRSSFCRTLQAKLQQSSGDSGSLACIAFDLDFYGRVGKTLGQRLAQRGLKGIAEAMSERLQDTAFLACGGGDQFFALLTSATEVEGEQWAERLRVALAGETFALEDHTVRVTASFGVADDAGARVDPRELMQRALEAQQLAKESGRNCVALYSQLHDRARSWASLATPGKLFETTVARDVMIPCTIVLTRDQPIRHAQSRLKRPTPIAVPVVDGVGRFVGYVTEEMIAQAPADKERIRDLAISDAPCMDEGTSFTNLIDFFTQDARSLVFIVGGGQPVGLVTRDTLTSLSDPVDKSTFRTDLADVISSEHLCVRDTAFFCDA